MRRIVQLERDPAQRLGDLLLSRGIANQVDEEDAGQASVWVLEETELDRARALLASFTADPELASDQVCAEAERIRSSREGERRRHARQATRYRPRAAAGGMGVMTGVLIALSVGATLATGMGENVEVWRWLAITDLVAPAALLPEVLHGQIWRLVTPIFVHLGIWHILFNMLWLRDLGTAIERVRGTGFAVGLVLALAAASNLVQYLENGPLFGGMSGVVYGLLGYVWVTIRREPLAGFFLSSNTLVWMLGWLVLCFTGIMGPVANAAHVGGLVGGMAIAWVHSALRRWRQER